ncbi:MAG: hypothetical protein RTU92_08600 [Candidatus Thorarchaeota archaeon]
MSNISDTWANSANTSNKPKAKKKNSATTQTTGKPIPKKGVSCWHNHPTYVIDGCEITGGSCTGSYAEGYDLYIALDGSGQKGQRSYPWNKGVDIYFRIQDMGVPESLTDFKKLIAYTAKEMRKGKSVFVGCIGGHGRTGLFLSALTTFMTKEPDSITKVRKEYCHKAVESSKQVNWLHEHFGITKVLGAKEYVSKGNSAAGTITDISWGHTVTSSKHHVLDGLITESEADTYCPVADESIFDIR